MSFEEKTIISNLIYSGKILKLEVAEVELPDGRHSMRECVRHSGGVAVLFVKDNKIALVKQYRYAYGKEIYEIPAGKLNAGENPAFSACRELEEETGYCAEHCIKLTTIYPTPGYTDEIIHIYYVDKANFVGQHLDEGEFLKCSFINIDEICSMIESGEISDAKTVVAVYKYPLKK